MKPYNNESTVIIENEILLDILNNQVERWTSDYIIQTLYSEMYERLIDSGCFDGNYFNPYEFVANDWVNYCAVLHFDDSTTAPKVGDDYESEDYGRVCIEAHYDNDNDGVYCLARFEY